METKLLLRSLSSSFVQFMTSLLHIPRSKIVLFSFFLLFVSVTFSSSRSFFLVTFFSVTFSSSRSFQRHRSCSQTGSTHPGKQLDHPARHTNAQAAKRRRCLLCRPLDQQGFCSLSVLRQLPFAMFLQH